MNNEIKNQIKPGLYYGLFCFTILMLTGCLSPRMLYNKVINVTNSPKWWGELAKGQVLELTEDALLGPQGLHLTARIVTGSNGTGEKVSVADYKTNPNRYAQYGVNLLQKGTKMRCVKLERFFTFETNNYILYAEILTGEHKDKLISIPVQGDPDKPGDLQLAAPFLQPLPSN